jgi:hypothetical protein
VSKVELFEKIRKDRRDQSLSVRALAVKFQVHRQTVRQALVSSVPPARKPARPNCKVLGPWKPWVDSVLAADLSAPGPAVPSFCAVLPGLVGGA